MIVIWRIGLAVGLDISERMHILRRYMKIEISVCDNFANRERESCQWQQSLVWINRYTFLANAYAACVMRWELWTEAKTRDCRLDGKVRKAMHGNDHHQRAFLIKRLVIILDHKCSRDTHARWRQRCRRPTCSRFSVITENPFVLAFPVFRSYEIHTKLSNTSKSNNPNQWFNLENFYCRLGSRRTCVLSLSRSQCSQCRKMS